MWIKNKDFGGGWFRLSGIQSVISFEHKKTQQRRSDFGGMINAWISALKVLNESDLHKSLSSAGL